MSDIPNPIAAFEIFSPKKVKKLKSNKKQTLKKAIQKKLAKKLFDKKFATKSRTKINASEIVHSPAIVKPKNLPFKLNGQVAQKM